METYPLLVASYNLAKSGTVEFKTHSDLVVIKEHSDLVREIIMLCDGRHAASDISKAIQARDQGYKPDLIRDIFDDLQMLGIVIDSRRLGEWMHEVSSNPMPYYHSLTEAEVERHRLSPRADPIQGRRMKLPKPETEFTQLLEKRYSCRSFDGEPLTIEEYAYLLRSAYEMDLGPVPSGGALYPLSLYLIVMKGSKDLPVGFYQYDQSSHELVVSNREYDEYEVALALDNDSLLYGASGVLIIAADLHRQNAKYSNRGYRYSLIEVGHVAQNVLLAAVDAGLTTLEYGGFGDGIVSELLDLSSRDEVPVIAVALGKVNSEAAGETSASTRTVLEEQYVGRAKPVNRVGLVHQNTGERPPFQMALAHYKPGTHQDPSGTYYGRLALGTGTSSDLAVLKAIAEAYERYVCGQVKIDIVCSVEDLPAPWIDPNRYVPFTDEQVHLLGFERFSPDKEWQWVTGETFTGETVYVPADLVFYPFAAEKHYGRRNCFSGHSSGVAAHTSLEEAKRLALLELIERDAIIRNWLTKSVPEKIHPDLLPTHLRNRVDYRLEQGWKIEVIDLSHSGVAAVCVFAVSLGKNKPHIVHGSAASERNLDEAVSKAFQEAEVGLVVRRDKKYKKIAPEAVDAPEDHGRLYYYPDHAGELAYLFAGEYSGVAPHVGNDDLFGKFQPIFITLTGSDSPLQVVRAISDRLVPINFGYGRDHISHHLLEKEVIETVPFPHYLA